MSTNHASVLIVARSGSLRDGLRALMTTSRRIELLEEAEDEAEVLRIVAEGRPAVVLLDASLSPGSVRALLDQIKLASPGTRRVVLAETVQQKQEIEAPGTEIVLLHGAPAATLLLTVEAFLPGPEEQVTG
ncbi:MAG TPA: hypothetical protein VF177_06340 [Anaerolineae bacterium]